MNLALKEGLELTYICRKSKKKVADLHYSARHDRHHFDFPRIVHPAAALPLCPMYYSFERFKTLVSSTLFLVRTKAL